MCYITYLLLHLPWDGSSANSRIKERKRGEYRGGRRDYLLVLRRRTRLDGLRPLRCELPQ